jgi:GNAT superfamily N-acetyltransferase
MNISDATPEDIPTLAELLSLLFAQEADFSPDLAKQAEGLRAIITQPQVGRILVARRGPRIVGMVNLLYTVSTAMGGRAAILEDMIVIPEERGRGTGADLLQHAVHTARESGCLRITLLTDRNNIQAQAFYRRHGFAPSAMVPLRLDLTQTPSK